MNYYYFYYYYSISSVVEVEHRLVGWLVGNWVRASWTDWLMMVTNKLYEMGIILRDRKKGERGANCKRGGTVKLAYISMVHTYLI